jgi:tryptophan synthase beta chain
VSTSSRSAAPPFPSSATDTAPLQEHPEVAQVPDDLDDSAAPAATSSSPASPGPRPERSLPDAGGHFDQFGGKFVPEALYAALQQLEEAFNSAIVDPEFQRELADLLADYTGRPSPITNVLRFAEQAAPEDGGPRPIILLKREDLNHTGSHKINNVLGQALLTRKMGKTRVIAETGAGQHGVATATAAALFGLECTVYMGKVDTERQALNVARMRLLGAEVIAVESGTQTLKDAMNDAMRDWVASVDRTHYLIGTVAGPHPFPMLVREFQRIISTEARAQVLSRYGRLPDAVAACVGGGSNALGIFADFIPDADVALYGFEAGGDGLETGRHAATISNGEVGVLHGMRTYVLQDADGQTRDSHSISAGLDYPGVGPEHSWLAATGRASYEPITDAEAMDAFALLSRTEGIVPAIESAHALAGALKLGRRLPSRADGQPHLILVNLSGRGDKDVDTAIDWFDLDTKGIGSESQEPQGSDDPHRNGTDPHHADAGHDEAAHTDAGHEGRQA